jgi:deazaflavin-dependent oxidoreductase (nitroreductase family)
MYCVSGGRLGRSWFAGAPVMVLRTVGRRSGEMRSAPILYLRDGDHLVVMPANAGVDRTPAWWLNLQAAGTGEAIVGKSRTTVSPRVLAGAEKQRLWSAFVEMYPQAAAYPGFTEREIPLVALEPVHT